MKPVLLLVHGWGFDARFWAPLRAALEGYESVAWDLGFFGGAARPELPVGRDVVAVGHSFGVLWLLHNRPVAWRALVAVNGFGCFTRREDFPQGQAARPLERMITQLGAAPGEVVAAFRARCGAAAAVPGVLDQDVLDQGALLEGLRGLAQWDERPAAVDLALCGRADPLVPEAMSGASFPADVTRWHEGGHLLPVEDPEWCAAQLRAFLEPGG
jgi:pimeloyl-[acyl-carrier protein] methyl ester esterase